MTTITLTNPWTGAIVERDITGITDQQVAAWALNQDICEELHGLFDTAEDFVAAYVNRVGETQAGIEILGA